MSQDNTAIQKAPLIVDPDWTFLNSLDLDPQASGAHPFLAGDAERALELIRVEGGRISSVVINPAIGSESVESLMSAAFESIFGVQIFFLCDAPKSKRENESRAMRTNQILEKPVSYAAILTWVEGVGRTTRDSAGTRSRSRVRGKDEDFSSITVDSMLVGGSLSIDVYIRLREDRYVRVVHAGDPLDARRLERYMKRGLKEFFLNKNQRENYRRTCETINEMLSASQKPELDKVG